MQAPLLTLFFLCLQNSEYRHSESKPVVASSTKGSILLLRASRLTFTGPGIANQDGVDILEDDRRTKPKKHSCAVSLVTVHRRERTEYNTSGKASCQYCGGRALDFRRMVSASK